PMVIGRQNTPRWLILMIDTLVVAASVILAYLVRFNFAIPAHELVTFPYVLGYITGVRVISFLLGRTYAGIIRYTSTQDAVRIAMVSLAGSLAFVGTNLVTYYGIDRFFFIPFSIIIIEFIVSIFGMTTFRLLVKIAYLEYINPRKERSGVIIFGAGEAGLITKRALDRDAGTRLRVVAFVDDDPRKAGSKLEGVDILHASRLEGLLQEGKAETLILAIQDIAATRKAQVIDLCLKHDIRVLNIPPVVRWINGQLSFRQLKEINIVDLLGRDVIQMDRQRMSAELQGKRILITGASGSIGSEIARQVAVFGPASLLLLDQSETPLFELENEMRLLFPEADLRVVIADITHIQRMEQVIGDYRPQIVF
ncbi:MAG TPA: polysaccharide biosynthesis protein, partial [Bacteroidales bacterium]|nr:polysaccharide biosynthesis protein [Bacteroidales bacterium]